MSDYKSFPYNGIFNIVLIIIIASAVYYFIRFETVFYIAAFYVILFLPALIKDFYYYRQRAKILEIFDIICPNCGTGNWKTSSYCAECGKNLKETFEYFIGSNSDIELTKEYLIEYKKNFLGKRNREINRYILNEIKNLEFKHTPGPYSSAYMQFDYNKRGFWGGKRVNIADGDEIKIKETLEKLDVNIKEGY